MYVLYCILISWLLRMLVEADTQRQRSGRSRRATLLRPLPPLLLRPLLPPVLLQEPLLPRVRLLWLLPLLMPRRRRAPRERRAGRAARLQKRLRVKQRRLSSKPGSRLRARLKLPRLLRNKGRRLSSVTMPSPKSKVVVQVCSATRFSRFVARNQHLRPAHASSGPAW